MLTPRRTHGQPEHDRLGIPSRAAPRTMASPDPARRTAIVPIRRAARVDEAVAEEEDQRAGAEPDGQWQLAADATASSTSS